MILAAAEGKLDSTVYDIVFYLHILSAIIGYGGVFLNGLKLPAEQDCQLHHGDMIRLGEFVLLFKHEEKLQGQVGLSTINLDADKIRREVDEFLSEDDHPDSSDKPASDKEE